MCFNKTRDARPITGYYLRLSPYATPDDRRDFLRLPDGHPQAGLRAIFAADDARDALIAALGQGHFEAQLQPTHSKTPSDGIRAGSIPIPPASAPAADPFAAVRLAPPAADEPKPDARVDMYGATGYMGTFADEAAADAHAASLGLTDDDYTVGPHSIDGAI